ncbi:MAG TPA: alkaline phosphatase family protein [Candidatus Cybelea sp.]|jgi:phospholipase C
MASPIKTVVIIVKENHTFDNYFGAFPGANGDPTLPQAPNPPTSDPNHTHQAWLDRKKTATRLGYKEADIPPYFAYARQFTLCDNFFSAVAGPSTPNHLMLIAADSPLIDNPPTYRGQKQQTYDLPSLPDQLDAAGLTWRNYGTGYPFTLIAKLGTRNMNPASDFAADAAAGQLPSVSWVYAPAALDEHPVGNVTDGANWTAGIVEAVARSSQWPESVVFVTWDCWGGWVDHVDPPLLEKWTDGTQFYPGGRVGCIAISPYAKRAYLSHAQHTHVSLVKFCEVTFGLRALNQRDTASDGMEDCFDFTSPPNLTLPQNATPRAAALGRSIKKPALKKTTRKGRPRRP